MTFQNLWDNQILMCGVDTADLQFSNITEYNFQDQWILIQ